MQNKGLIITLAACLALVSAFYLSFSFVTSSYDKKAAAYAHYQVIKSSCNAYQSLREIVSVVLIPARAGLRRLANHSAQKSLPASLKKKKRSKGTPVVWELTVFRL